MQDTGRGIKETVARAYESCTFDRVLGDILHPGGLKLTVRTAEVAGIRAGSRVLDIASGKGTTACFLSMKYDCQVIGIEFSLTSICSARSKALAESPSAGVEFIAGDAESLPFRSSSFDVVISECSFSLLPNKEIAAAEFVRILKPGGRLVITDVVLRCGMSQEFQTQAIFACCIAGAKTVDDYVRLFTKAGFGAPYVEDHSIEMKKVGYRILVNHGSLDAFSAQFGEGKDTCCSNKEGRPTFAQFWKSLPKEQRPGYGLLAFIKVGENAKAL